MKKLQMNFMVCALVICTMCGTAFTAKAQFSGGTGASGDPYIITTAAELAQLATYVTEGNAAYNAAHYELGNDIDLSAYGSGFNSGKGWIPIGTLGDYFKGVFDGADYEITGLYIDDVTLSYGGVFGCLENAIVKNLGVINADITGDIRVGVIAGFCDGGSIINCYSTGILNGNRDLGGVAGHLWANTAISNCYSSCDINGTLHLGGISGLINGGSITECYAIGNISGDTNIGGIVGTIGNNSFVTNSYATGNISGDDQIGGAVGFINGITTFTNCYAVGLVVGMTKVGGFAGESGSGTITDCYFDTQTTGQADGVGSGSGFAVGRTTADMQLESTFTTAGWDFTTVWIMPQDGGYRYPVFQWQNVVVGNPFTIDEPDQIGDNAWGSVHRDERHEIVGSTKCFTHAEMTDFWSGDSPAGTAAMVRYIEVDKELGVDFDRIRRIHNGEERPSDLINTAAIIGQPDLVYVNDGKTYIKWAINFADSADGEWTSRFPAGAAIGYNFYLDDELVASIPEAKNLPSITIGVPSMTFDGDALGDIEFGEEYKFSISLNVACSENARVNAKITLSDPAIGNEIKLGVWETSATIGNPTPDFYLTFVDGEATISRRPFAFTETEVFFVLTSNGLALADMPFEATITIYEARTGTVLISEVLTDLVVKQGPQVAVVMPVPEMFECGENVVFSLTTIAAGYEGEQVNAKIKFSDPAVLDHIIIDVYETPADYDDGNGTPSIEDLYQYGADGEMVLNPISSFVFTTGAETFFRITNKGTAKEEMTFDVEIEIYLDPEETVLVSHTLENLKVEQGAYLTLNGKAPQMLVFNRTYEFSLSTITGCFEGTEVNAWVTLSDEAVGDEITVIVWTESTSATPETLVFTSSVADLSSQTFSFTDGEEIFFSIVNNGDAGTDVVFSMTVEFYDAGTSIVLADYTIEDMTVLSDENSKGDLIDIVWDCNKGKTKCFNLTADKDFIEEWGEGDEEVTTGMGNSQTLSHIYSEDGSYMVSLSGINGCKFGALYVAGMQVTGLDLSFAANLQILYCENNKIDTLNLPQQKFTFVQCYNNSIWLSDLYDLSEKVNNNNNKRLGTQNISMGITGRTLDLSNQAEFGLEKTNFEIADCSACTVNDGTITFPRGAGTYTITLTNDAITSHPDYPAKVILTVEVESRHNYGHRRQMQGRPNRR